MKEEIGFFSPAETGLFAKIAYLHTVSLRTQDLLSIVFYISANRLMERVLVTKMKELR